MRRIAVTAGLCLMLASGVALAQTGTGTGAPASEANTPQNQQNPIRPDPGAKGASGITTQSTTPSTAPSASDRPTEAQCRAGWDSSMRWTRAEFEAACR